MQQYRKNLGKVSLTAEGAWNLNNSYDILSIVYDEHTQHGFISRKAVPQGVDLYNKEYWMPLNVSGYADNNVIILSKKTSDASIQSYTLEEAIASIKSVGRRPGAILGFYNENNDRLDIGGRWELWQFNDTNVYNWDNVDSWQNLYYNYNKFMGWFKDENFLTKYTPFPEIGCYAFVGSEFNEATVYRCDNKYVWNNTTQHAWDYVKVIVEGNVSVGKNGNWFNNGVDTGIPASVKGENGKTPVFREKDNTIQYSFDNVNWITISDKVAAWFRWNVTTGDTQANNVGRIQITRDNVTWTNLSGDIINNLHISRYIGADESLPTNGIAEGTIYAKGPTYADGDTSHANPIYRLWVYAWKGNTLAWQDNGEFTSIAAGVVQETGDSETEVMSQKVVSKKFSELSSEVSDINAEVYQLGKTNTVNSNYLKCTKGLIQSNGFISDSEQYCYTDFVQGAYGSCTVKTSTNTIYGYTRYYNSSKEYIGHDMNTIDQSLIYYTRYTIQIYDISDIQVIQIPGITSSFIPIKYKYNLQSLDKNIKDTEEHIYILKADNLLLYNNEAWNSLGLPITRYGWIRTPLIPIEEINNVKNIGIIFYGRAYNYAPDNIFSALFFDENKKYIEGSGVNKVITSGHGTNKFSYEYIESINAKYIAFNSITDYWDTLSIKGLGIHSIREDIESLNKEIVNLKEVGNNDNFNFKQIFTSDNPDKQIIVDDFISNINSNNLTKALYYNMMRMKNEGYAIYGQSDDFTMGVLADGTEWDNTDNTPFYANKIRIPDIPDSEPNVLKYTWEPKNLDDIDLTAHCNTYAACGKLPAVLCVDLGPFLYNLLRGSAYYASFERASLIALIRKYYKEVKGLITCQIHVQGPYGGDYTYVDPTYPDAFEQMLADNPTDGGVAKKYFNDLTSAISDLMQELVDDKGNKIPIVMRPFAETTNSYGNLNAGFWWHYSTDEEYKQVFRNFVNKLRETCDNILFVFNPLLNSTSNTITESILLQRYPGDEYVDIIGVNIYENVFNKHFPNGLYSQKDVASTVDTVATKHKKICVRCETGDLGASRPEFWNDLFKFYVETGGVGYGIVWNNQSKTYWHTPYDINNPAMPFYKRFLNRNLVFLPPYDIYKI